MGHYKSNLRDIEFNLFEVLGREEIYGTGPFAEMDVETARSVLAEIARLAEHELADSYAEADRTPPVFDPATNRWEGRTSLPKPRAGVNGVAARGCFYVFGGEGNDADPRGIFAEMDVYNPRTNTWAPLPAIPTPVHGVTGSAYVDGLIYLPGGGTSLCGSSGSTLHQVFRPNLSCE